jgi:hypothetical protein
MTTRAPINPPTQSSSRLRGQALPAPQALLTRTGAGRAIAARPLLLVGQRWLPGPAAPHGAAAAAVPAATAA